MAYMYSTQVRDPFANWWNRPEYKATENSARAADRSYEDKFYQNQRDDIDFMRINGMITKGKTMTGIADITHDGKSMVQNNKKSAFLIFSIIFSQVC